MAKHAKAQAEGESVAKSTALMSLATLGSRATGLIRTWTMAFALGNTLISSAYQVANNMPNVVFDLVAGGLLGAAFIPVFMLEFERGGERAGSDFANNMLNLTIVVLGVLSILSTVFAPAVIATQTFTVGQTALVSEYAVTFFRIFAVQIVFYGVSGIVGGVLNANRVYFLPALAPALNNVCCIVSFLVYIPLSRTDLHLAMVVLAVGTTLGVVVQTLVQIPAMRRIGFKWRWYLNLRDPALLEALKIAVPTCVYIVGTLIAFTCRNAFSLQVGDDGPSTLLYAWMWFQLPYGVVAVSLSRTMFTEMSESCARGDFRRLRRQVKSGVSTTLLYIVPLAALMGVFSDSIMQLFQAGRFDEAAVHQVGDILMLWCISLPFYSVWMFLYNVFASLRRFGTFAAISCIMIVPQCALYWVLCSAETAGLAGVCFADLFYYVVCCVVGLLVIQGRIGSLKLGAILWKAVRVVLASTVGAGIGWALALVLPITGSGMLQGLITLTVCGTVGLIACFAACWVLRVPEMAAITGLVRRVTKRR